MTITIVEVVNHFSHYKSFLQSHISKSINFKDLHEVFQHARTVVKNPNDYYHISDEYIGYDAFSFNRNNLEKIIIEENFSLMTFHEKKMIMGTSKNFSKISSFFKQYSSANTEGLLLNQGARPCPVDQLEFGITSREGYNILKTLDLSIYNKPTVTIEDYSDVFAKIVLHPKHGGLTHGTIITDSGFEHLKFFYHVLEKNNELCSEINELLKQNPFFPLLLN